MRAEAHVRDAPGRSVRVSKHRERTRWAERKGYIDCAQSDDDDDDDEINESGSDSDE